MNMILKLKDYCCFELYALYKWYGSILISEHIHSLLIICPNETFFPEHIRSFFVFKRLILNFSGVYQFTQCGCQNIFAYIT